MSSGRRAVAVRRWAEEVGQRVTAERGRARRAPAPAAAAAVRSARGAWQGTRRSTRPPDPPPPGARAPRPRPRSRCPPPGGPPRPGLTDAAADLGHVGGVDDTALGHLGAHQVVQCGDAVAAAAAARGHSARRRRRASRERRARPRRGAAARQRPRQALARVQHRRHAPAAAGQGAHVRGARRGREGGGGAGLPATRRWGGVSAGRRRVGPPGGRLRLLERRAGLWEARGAGRAAQIDVYVPRQA
jgi:hypothetical protein